MLVSIATTLITESAYAGLDVEANPTNMADVPGHAFETLNRLEPAATIGATYFTPGKVKTDKDVEVTQVQSYFNVPLTGGGDEDGWIYFVGLNFSENEFRVSDTKSGADAKQRLYDITVPLTLFRQADAETAYVAYIAPGLRSSLEYVGDEDFGGDVIFQVVKDKGIHSYQYGAGIITAFGESQLVPVVSYSYQPNSQLNVTLGLPTFVDYAVSESQSYFARLTPNGGQWHAYDGNKKDNGFDYKQEGFRFGGGGEWQLFGPLYLELEAGVQFGQKVTYKERGQEVTAKFDPSNYINASLNIYFD
ncbi:DUF6268 family outer membrane beta-barrel protein [Bacterioplanoides sp.]|uniref:DUF6268 family outer membrane beta-barrel protein n=1 Tax=Bacterioplanoides sp. TaxID=2066072 RepID=UPI003B5B4704